MEHNLNKQSGLPMLFTADLKNRIITFASQDMTMEGDTVSGFAFKGTIKEILEERPSRGRWKKIGFKEPPTFYKIQLH